jgi:5,5'-dehydrodivanillate O-demethylase
MIPTQQNDRFTQVGPGTPGGGLLRCYWWPIAVEHTLHEEPVQRVRLLGEDLVLFRDESERLGLVAERCPHRGASLAYGFTDAQGLRCPYHGWLFDTAGACLEQPNQFTDVPALRQRCGVTAYPVAVLGGLVFAYLGTAPAPALPTFDLYVLEETALRFRDIGWATIDCNWLQIMENSLDPTHAEWLHGKLFDYHLQRSGGDPTATTLSGAHAKLAFDRFDHGIIKRRLRVGQSEDHDDWRVGHPAVFPNILRLGGDGRSAFQIRVPIDDHHTMHFWYTWYELPAGFEDVVRAVRQVDERYEVRLKGPDGEFLMDLIDAQDAMVWITQGATADRRGEHLCQGDEGVAAFRKLLTEQLEAHEAGRDPMNVFRTPMGAIELPAEHRDPGIGGSRGNPLATYLRTHARFSNRVREGVRLIDERLGLPAREYAAT